ncbi:MAG TPA: redoxin domain-containing protein [Tepidisphaeraceae bacterium]|jgi:thiol-disulfide isomerase/thioredoxin
MRRTACSLWAVLSLIMACTWSAWGRPASQPTIETLPASRGGQDLLGTRLPAVRFDRWLNTTGDRPPESKGAVTLYRWWTDTCPFCAKTLPAIEQLRREFGPRGLKVVAVYHPKPPGDVADAKVLAAARRIGWDGAIAIDSHWDALRTVWLSTGQRRATSVSFLVDAQGVIRFVHPGVQYFPSDDPEAAGENADYLLLRSAIDKLLPAAPATQPAGMKIGETDAEEAVARVPEVGRFMDSVNRRSHGEAHGLLFSRGRPADAPDAWEIYVGEDRDDEGAAAWHRFRVDARSGAITVDAGRGAGWFSLERWRGMH